MMTFSDTYCRDGTGWGGDRERMMECRERQKRRDGEKKKKRKDEVNEDVSVQTGRQDGGWMKRF